MGKVGRLRRMGRLQGFIEAMDQLGQTIEVFVNASELVCFIWVRLIFLAPSLTKYYVARLQLILVMMFRAH